MGWSSSRMLLATAKQHAAEKLRIIPRFMEMGLKMWCMPQNVQFTPQMSSSMGKIWQNEVLNHQIWVVVHQKVQTTPQEPWSKTSTSAVFCWKLRLLPRDVAAARVSSQSSATNARHTLAAAKKNTARPGSVPETPYPWPGHLKHFFRCDMRIITNI